MAEQSTPAAPGLQRAASHRRRRSGAAVPFANSAIVRLLMRGRDLTTGSIRTHTWAPAANAVRDANPVAAAHPARPRA